MGILLSVADDIVRRPPGDSATTAHNPPGVTGRGDNAPPTVQRPSQFYEALDDNPVRKLLIIGVPILWAMVLNH